MSTRLEMTAEAAFLCQQRPADTILDTFLERNGIETVMC
jgi:hypothetical protein